jgi:hypothetical protein
LSREDTDLRSTREFRIHEVGPEQASEEPKRQRSVAFDEVFLKYFAWVERTTYDVAARG